MRGEYICSRDQQEDMPCFQSQAHRASCQSAGLVEQDSVHNCTTLHDFWEHQYQAVLLELTTRYSAYDQEHQWQPRRYSK